MENKGWALAGLALVVASGQVFAAPRESATFTNVNSTGGVDDANNVIQTRTFTGGYLASRIGVTGSLTEVDIGTYASEARIRVTDSNAAVSVLQPFSTAGFTGTVTVPDATVILLGQADANANGEWSFRFYESFVDNDVGLADAVWDTLTLTLNDDPFPPGEGGTDAGELPTTAAVPVGTGPLLGFAGSLTSNTDVDMVKIRISEPASFSASTVGQAGWDTQLFLFNADGRGVAANDDYVETGATAFQSRITSQFVASVPAGDYYIAISRYNKDPLSASGLIFGTPLARSEVNAAGPGGADPISGWNAGQFGDFGSYNIVFTGVAYPGASSSCVADFTDAGGSGTPDGGVTIEDLLFYLDIFSQGVVRADVDNGTGTGTTDGGVAIEDLLYFLQRFADGC